MMRGVWNEDSPAVAKQARCELDRNRGEHRPPQQPDRHKLIIQSRQLKPTIGLLPERN